MTQVGTFVMLQKLKHLIFDMFDTLTILSQYEVHACVRL
jgi:hypothetical protein